MKHNCFPEIDGNFLVAYQLKSISTPDSWYTPSLPSSAPPRRNEEPKYLLTKRQFWPAQAKLGSTWGYFPGRGYDQSKASIALPVYGLV